MANQKKTKMEVTCYKNGKFGAITWAVLDALRKSGASAKEIGYVVKLMNKRLPKLGSSEKTITRRCRMALNSSLRAKRNGQAA